MLMPSIVKPPRISIITMKAAIQTVEIEVIIVNHLPMEVDPLLMEIVILQVAMVLLLTIQKENILMNLEIIEKEEVQ